MRYLLKRCSFCSRATFVEIPCVDGIACLFSHSRDGYDDEYEDEDADDYGTDDVGNLMDFIGAPGNADDDEAMDIDGQELTSANRAPSRSTWTASGGRSGHRGTTNSGQRLTADLFSQAFENVLARRNVSDRTVNPAPSIPGIPGT